jgi:hypothetical protein
MDGGEIYGLYTKGEFECSYELRKNTIPTRETWMPEPLRQLWKAESGITFGLWDNSDWGANPSAFKRAMINGYNRCDQMVWIYCEGVNLIEDVSSAKPWADSIRAAKEYVLETRGVTPAAHGPQSKPALSDNLRFSSSVAHLVSSSAWRLAVVDSKGRTLATRTGDAGVVSVPLSPMRPGIYIVTFASDNIIISRQRLITR